MDYEKFHSDIKLQRRVIDNNNFTYLNIIEAINKRIDPLQKVLDIGCGVGTLAYFIANKGNKVMGIDVSKKAIKAATENAKRLNLESQITFKTMNFPLVIPKERFDLIILSEVLEHIEDEILALKNTYSLLVNGGIAIITVPSKNAPMYRLGMATKFDTNVGHLRRYSVPELLNKCRCQGFLIVDTKKTEGILRNFLFVNPVASNLLRFMRSYIGYATTLVDNLLIPLFGESNIIVVVQRPL